jgi:GR25 family glycosyltransferase involved in LPS biosynthesis
MHAYIINLDKNKERWNTIFNNYQMSDLLDVPMERFSAIYGKNVNPDEWLSLPAKQELYETEKLGYRTKHYQLTRGAIGCFLSHYTLAKQLLTDKEKDVYFMIEDDAGFYSDTYAQMKTALYNAPSDWDIILLGYHRLKKDGMKNTHYAVVKSFWGTFGYLLTKAGAKKFIDQVDKDKIDGQIDSFMSWMSQKKLLNIYALEKPIIYMTKSDTDIQMILKEQKGVDPYSYRDIQT